MKLRLWAVVFSICVVISCISAARNQIRDKSHETPITYETYSLVEEDRINFKWEDEDPRDQMTKEILQVWTAFLNRNEVKAEDPRWEMLPEYAIYLANTIYYYQDYGTDIDTILPNHSSTHIAVATIAIIETAINHKAIGKRGEVGLLQIHGPALAGYRKKEVQSDPELGIRLGVRWLAITMSECPSIMRKLKHNRWDNKSWLKAMSIYAAGGVIGKKDDGTCSVLKTGIRRTRMMNRNIRQLKTRKI